MDSVAEVEVPVATAEFGCQTEVEEAISLLIHITPPPPETAEFGVQVEQEVPEPKLMADIEIQAEPEPLEPLGPTHIIERAEIGIQHEVIESSRLYAESSIETDPIIKREVTPTTLSALLSIPEEAEVQTLSVQTVQIEVQTLPIPVPDKVDVETPTTHSSDDDTF